MCICADESKRTKTIYDTVRKTIYKSARAIHCYGSRQARAEAYRRAEITLDLGKSAIIDGTHTEAWRRSQNVQQYREFGAKAVAAAVFDTPLEISKQRNAARSRVVPEYALERMHTALQKKPVSHKEGFDAIYIVR